MIVGAGAGADIETAAAGRNTGTVRIVPGIGFDLDSQFLRNLDLNELNRLIDKDNRIVNVDIAYDFFRINDGLRIIVFLYFLILFAQGIVVNLVIIVLGAIGRISWRYGDIAAGRALCVIRLIGRRFLVLTFTEGILMLILIRDVIIFLKVAATRIGIIRIVKILSLVIWGCAVELIQIFFQLTVIIGILGPF